MIRAMHRRRIAHIIAAFALTAALGGLPIALASSADAAMPAQFRRGIGITTMAWAEVEPESSHAFVFPPFADRTLTNGELQALRRNGFDFVRFAVDPGPFLQFTGSRRDTLDRMLMERVKLILDAGLGVIVDFHPSDLNPDYSAEALTAGAATPIFQAYIRLLAHTAVMLAALHSDNVALEIMNEPPVEQALWQPMLEAAYAAVRASAARLPIVVQGGAPSSVEGLLQMRTAPFINDPAVLFTFHYYDPYQFTHQGASWNNARYLSDVPYPPWARPLKDSLDASAALIAAADLPTDQKSAAYHAAQRQLESYRASGFDRHAIGNRFTEIAAWARAQGIAADRILLGEFGARETPLQRDSDRAAERARWFRDVREEADTLGFGWAVWVYRGQGGFALASETGGGIEPAIAAALGLNSPAARKAAVPAAATRLRIP